VPPIVPQTNLETENNPCHSIVGCEIYLALFTSPVPLNDIDTCGDPNFAEHQKRVGVLLKR